MTQLPLQISFHGLEHSGALEASIRAHAKSLKLSCDQITRCQVVLEKPHRPSPERTAFRVRIRVTVSWKDLVVEQSREVDHVGEAPYVTVREAFNAMRGRLQEYVLEQPHGRPHASPVAPCYDAPKPGSPTSPLSQIEDGIGPAYFSCKLNMR